MEAITTKNMEIGLTTEELQTLWHACFILSDLRETLEKDRIKLKENKSRILEDARREAKIIIMEAKEEANEVIRDLERMRQKGQTADFSQKAINPACREDSQTRS